jgi:hypothetical protein
MRAPLTARQLPVRSFARELCLAVTHRWQPERIFVVLTLTAYFDESGTHDDSTATVMAGVMANALQWERFESAFSGLRQKYDFQVLHTRKFKRRAGDFKGWSPLRQLALMTNLAEIADTAFSECVTVSLDNADYEANYKGGDKPRRLRIESKYGLCFKNCLIFFILESLKPKYFHGGRPPKLHFILERGHKNWNEVRDIFNATKKEVQGYGADLLGDITFADKADCAPLMMADFLAHAIYLNRRDELPDPSDQPFLRDDKPPSAGVTNLRFKPGGLADLKGVMIEKLMGASAKRPFSGERSS